MTLGEYQNKMSAYADALNSVYDSEWDNLYKEISLFQQEFMENILDEYEKNIDCEAKFHICRLLQHAIKISESGSSIIDVKTKDIADEIEEIIWEEIGDYLLDYEIYEENGHWVVDCMFAGYYVPYWDGWNDD